MQKPISAKKAAFFYLILFAFMVVFIELTTKAFFFIREVKQTVTKRDYSENLKAMDVNMSDVEIYQAEAKAVYDVGNMDFDDYRGYRPKGNYKGKFLSTDQEGFRNTVQYHSGKAGVSVHVALFGGSTQWGVGTLGDENTIASQLAKSINRLTDVPVVVHNFGVGGYAIAQETVLLLEKLEQVPIDIAVFFDWVNEVEHGQRELNVFGTPQKGLLTPEWLGKATAMSFCGAWHLEKILPNTMRLVSGLGKRLMYYWGPSEVVAQHQGRNHIDPSRPPYNFMFLSAETHDAQAERVVSHYLKLKKVIEGASERFGFRPIFALQPMLATKRQVHENEERRYSKNPLMAKILERAESKLSATPNFVDMTECIQTPEHVYVDDHHTGKVGNGMIADCMALIILPQISSLARR